MIAPIDLASRWSWWQAMGWPTPPDGMDHDETTRWLEAEGIEQRPLTADELAQLTAWVSGWIVGWRRGAGAIGDGDREEAALDLALELGMHPGDACDLMALGGWPKIPQPRRLTREEMDRAHAEATGETAAKIEDCDCGPGARFDEERQACRECGRPVIDDGPVVPYVGSPTEPGWWLYSGEPCHVVAHDGGLWAWCLDERRQAKTLVDVRQLNRSWWGGRVQAPAAFEAAAGSIRSAVSWLLALGADSTTANAAAIERLAAHTRPEYAVKHGGEIGEWTPVEPDIPRDYVVAREQLARLLDAIMPDEQAARRCDPVGTVAEVDAALIRLASRS